MKKLLIPLFILCFSLVLGAGCAPQKPASISESGEPTANQEETAPAGETAENADEPEVMDNEGVDIDLDISKSDLEKLQADINKMEYEDLSGLSN